MTYLMNTDVSLFSFGMYQLDVELKTLRGRYPAIFATSYSWDENRIILIAFSLDGAIPPTREKCVDLVKAIRTDALIDPNSGKLIGGMENSAFSSFFSPLGYSLKGAPKDELSKIDQIMEIKVSLNGKEPNSRIACEGPLVSDKILFQDQP